MARRDRSITDRTTKVRTTIRSRWRADDVRPRRYECSSTNSYGSSGVLVTEFQKKIFFLPGWTTRSCLTPRPRQYFIAERGSSAANAEQAESVVLQSIRSDFDPDWLRCTRLVH